jgi:hypothetical protein
MEGCSSPGAIQQFNIRELHLTLSPRFGQRDAEHIRMLAERIDQLPPILVHLPSREIIDGVHRVLATRLVGRTTVLAEIVRGTLADAYVAAVQANISHGKPLSASERQAAVRRILATHVEWSDRRIADVCGVSVSTVATERGRIAPDEAPSGRRVGRDGRWRPVDAAAVRNEVLRHLDAAPNATLREVARSVGTSQATVLDVKRRLQRGEKILPPRLEADGKATDAPSVSIIGDDRALRADHVASFTEWFEAHCITDQALERVGEVPVSRVYVLADAAHRQAELWANLATAFENRARGGR